MTSMGYCPTCQKNVYKKREDFSYLLAFILALTGIGLVIYILYYIDQKPKYCIHCDTKCLVYQLEDKSDKPNEIEFKEPKLITENKVRFCPNCGGEIGARDSVKFCYICGSNLE